jgi:L-lactate utilization protein LutC
MLSNLSKLYGGAVSYDKCKSDIISDTMKEFKNKKLKDRGGKVIKKRDQAIAIALSQSQSQCKYTPSDVKKLIEKVNNDLNDKNKELNLTNIIETKNAIESLLKMKKSKRIWMFKKLLWDKIIDNQLNENNINDNMWKEIKKIHNL